MNKTFERIGNLAFAALAAVALTSYAFADSVSPALCDLDDIPGNVALVTNTVSYVESMVGGETVSATNALARAVTAEIAASNAVERAAAKEYADGIVSDAVTNLTELIGTKAEDVTVAAKNYTDEVVGESSLGLTNYIDTVKTNLEHRIDLTPLESRSGSTTSSQPINKAQITTIHFKPEVFGMVDNDMLNGFFVQTKDTDPTPRESLVARVFDWTGAVVADSNPVVFPATPDTPVYFQFPQSVVLASSNQLYTINFVDGGTNTYIGIRLWVEPTNSESIYLTAQNGTVQKRWKPKMTVLYYSRMRDVVYKDDVQDEVVEDSPNPVSGGAVFSATTAISNYTDSVAAGYLPLITDKDGNKTAVSVGQISSSIDLPQNVGLGSFRHGAESLAIGSFSYAHGENAFAKGVYSWASGIETKAFSNCTHAIGFRAICNDDFSYVFQGYKRGGNINGNYLSHGEGTFNINPVGGVEGFYIGETNLAAFLAAYATTNALNDAISSKRDYSDFSYYEKGHLYNTNSYFIVTVNGVAEEWRFSPDIEEYGYLWLRPANRATSFGEEFISVGSQSDSENFEGYIHSRPLLGSGDKRFVLRDENGNTASLTNGSTVVTIELQYYNPIVKRLELESNYLPYSGGTLTGDLAFYSDSGIRFRNPQMVEFSDSDTRLLYDTTTNVPHLCITNTFKGFSDRIANFGDVTNEIGNAVSAVQFELESATNEVLRAVSNEVARVESDVAGKRDYDDYSAWATAPAGSTPQTIDRIAVTTNGVTVILDDKNFVPGFANASRDMLLLVNGERWILETLIGNAVINASTEPPYNVTIAEVDFRVVPQVADGIAKMSDVSDATNAVVQMLRSPQTVSTIATTNLNQATATGASFIFFRPRAFGMTGGDLMKSFTVRTTTLSNGNVTVPVMARLLRYDGAASQTFITASDEQYLTNVNSTVEFTFETPAEMASGDQYYKIEFFSHEEASNTLSKLALRFYVLDERDPDCYVFNNSLWRPVMSTTFVRPDSFHIDGSFTVSTNDTITIQTWDQIRLASGQTLPEFVAASISAAMGNVQLNREADGVSIGTYEVSPKNCLKAVSGLPNACTLHESGECADCNATAVPVD